MSTANTRCRAASSAAIAVTLVVVLTRSDGCAFKDADVDIALYSTVGADADQIHELSDLIDDIEQVEGVERAFFRSPQEALEQFEYIHADSEAIKMHYRLVGTRPMTSRHPSALWSPTAFARRTSLIDFLIHRPSTN